jgi:hypothetical protein
LAQLEHLQDLQEQLPGVEHEVQLSPQLPGSKGHENVLMEISKLELCHKRDKGRDGTIVGLTCNHR